MVTDLEKQVCASPRIEKAFGPDMDDLLRMQLAYDVAKTREHARGISIKRYAPA